MHREEPSSPGVVAKATDRQGIAKTEVLGVGGWGLRLVLPSTSLGFLLVHWSTVFSLLSSLQKKQVEKVKPAEVAKPGDPV